MSDDSTENSHEDQLQALRDEIMSLRKEGEDIATNAVFAEAMENSSEAIVIYDSDGCLVACNQNFRSYYGYSKEEAKKGVHYAALGRLDIERGNVVIGDEYGSGDEYLERKAEYRKKLDGSFVVQLSDGRWIKTVDRRMQRGGFVSVQIDITDMKKNEQVLRDAMEAAERAAHYKSEFLANISHDLRTPLNAIIGFSELIVSEQLGPLKHDLYKDYIKDINASGVLLLSIVNDILDTVKLENGKVVLNPEVFDAIECSEVIVKRMLPMISKKNISISIDKSPDFPETICTDKRATIQILNNLISNATRHSKIDEKISIRWRKYDDQNISVEVADNGSGMSSEILENIGQPFLQSGSHTIQRQEKGTGLGLYITNKLIIAMGGRMDVESEIEKGCRVTMTWPAISEQ